jgi:beta-lactam-binding protein with PASTA domain
MYLQSLGLKLGIINYKPDIARNAVLEQTLNDIEVKPGAKIPLGSSIGLVLGSGVGGGDFEVPNLIGMTLLEAKSWLTSLSLNIGSIIPVGAIADTNAAFIVKQSPDVYIETVPGQRSSNKIRSGQLLDIYISAAAPIKDTVQAPINQ